METLKLYSKSGKLKGTVEKIDEHRHSFHPILTRQDYYAADRQDYLAKMEQGDFVWDEKLNEFVYTKPGTIFGVKAIPTFFTVQQPPETVEALHASPFYLLDGNLLVPDERRDGRTKVANVYIVFSTASGTIGGYSLDSHYVMLVPGRFKEEFVDNLVRGKEYIFYSPEHVAPKQKRNFPTGQTVAAQQLVEALWPEESQTASHRQFSKPAAIRCLWEALGGSTLLKLSIGDKGVYLNTAVTTVHQIAFLVAAGYKLYLRTSVENRRKDYFAVKGS